MEIAALMISIFALLAAAASVVYTRQQAQIARALHDLEEERRQAETEPVLRAKTENVGSWHRMWLLIDRSEPLARIDAEIVGGRGISFSRGVEGIDPSAPFPVLSAFYIPEFLRSDCAALHTGDSACWRVELEDDRTDVARLRVTCQGTDGGTWTVHVPLDMAPLDRTIG